MHVKITAISLTYECLRKNWEILENSNKSKKFCNIIFHRFPFSNREKKIISEAGQSHLENNCFHQQWQHLFVSLWLHFSLLMWSHFIVCRSKLAGPFWIKRFVLYTDYQAAVLLTAKYLMRTNSIYEAMEQFLYHLDFSKGFDMVPQNILSKGKRD